MKISSANLELNTARPSAIVLGLTGTGLAIARELSSMGVEVIGVDSNRLEIGHFSKWCRNIPYLSFREDDQLLAALEHFAHSLPRKAVLFPAHDRYVTFISNHSSELKKWYIFSSSLQPEVTDIFVNKKRFYEICIDNEIDIPRTYYPKGIDDIVYISRNIQFPCIIKPFFSHLWRRKLHGRKVIELQDQETLIEQYHRISAWDGGFMIQEVIPGPENSIYVFGGYFDRQSRPLTTFTGRKLRQYPPNFGSGSLVESYTYDELTDLSVSLLSKLGVHGIYTTEFKRDSRDGKLKMIEINQRAALWFALTGAAGVKVVYSAYRDLIGEEVDQNICNQLDGIRWVYLQRDVLASLHYFLRSELSIADWIVSMKGKKVYALLSRDDMRTVMATPLYLASQFAKILPNLK